MKILFLGDGYPVATNAGSILYQKILRIYGIRNCCYYGIGSKTKNEWPIDFQEMPKENSCLRFWPVNRITKYLKKIPFIEEVYYFIQVPITVRRIRNFALRNNIKIVVAVFRADVLAIVNEFVQENNFPLIGYISDTVESEYGDKPSIYKYKVQEYIKAIAYAQGVYVAGEAMNKYIKAKFNKNTLILRLGYTSNLNLTRKMADKKKINVFFSGSVYAKNEFESFLKALSILAAKHPKNSITFTTATTYINKFKPENVKINNLGWIDEQKLISEMHNAHIGYIPYKFDEKDATQMRYAFPSKTGFYLSTGLPIFFHGPNYSSMGMFFDKYPCGIHCASMKERSIVAHLEKILFEKDFYKQCLSASIEAYRNEFSLEVMANSLKTLVP